MIQQDDGDGDIPEVLELVQGGRVHGGGQGVESVASPQLHPCHVLLTPPTEGQLRSHNRLVCILRFLVNRLNQ